MNLLYRNYFDIGLIRPCDLNTAQGHTSRNSDPDNNQLVYISFFIFISFTHFSNNFTVFTQDRERWLWTWTSVHYTWNIPRPARSSRWAAECAETLTRFRRNSYTILLYARLLACLLHTIFVTCLYVMLLHIVCAPRAPYTRSTTAPKLVTQTNTELKNMCFIFS